VRGVGVDEEECLCSRSGGIPNRRPTAPVSYVFQCEVLDEIGTNPVCACVCVCV